MYMHVHVCTATCTWVVHIRERIRAWCAGVCLCAYMCVYIQAQSLSTQQRIMSFGTQRATDETMINDNRSSSTALLRNISEAESLKNRCVCVCKRV